MNVQITTSGRGRRTVVVDGIQVGQIRCCTPDGWWHDYTGRLRAGARWLPEGVASDVPGPFTPADAALLLLALHDYDRVTAIKALYGKAA